MKSRIVQASLVAGAGLAVLLLVGAVFGQPWLLALVGAGFAAVLIGLAADTNVRVRRIERRLDKGARGVPDAALTPPPATAADVVGTVRLLQAQYTARLDRLQGTVEQLAAGHDGAERSES